MTIETTVLLDSDDISSVVVDVKARAGRSLETGAFDAGSCVITVENWDGNLNPYFLVDTSALLLESGDYLLLENGGKLLLESGNGAGAGAYGEILTGRTVTVRDGSTTVFVGFVEDYDFNWDGELRPTVTMSVRDALATLGTTELEGWAPSQQLTGARVTAVLDRPEVAFPTGASARDIATGTQPLMAGTSTTDDNGTVTYGVGSVPTGTNALRYLQDVNEAENGRLFVDRTGKLIFQDRYASFGVSASASFDDTQTNIPFHGIDVRFGTELLHFQVTVDRGIGEPQKATNTGAAAAYPKLGLRNLTRRGEFNSAFHAAALAEFLVERLSSTRAVVSGLTVWLNDLTSPQRTAVCELDIGDVINLTWTPQGTSGGVSQTLVIEGRSYQTRASTSWVSFQLSDASDPDYFVVGTDAVDGPKPVAP